MFKKLTQVPTQPGVYWFINKKNQVIYVGKAKNLKHRLQSYRLITSSSPKTKAMLESAVKFKTLTVDSEIEALCLEAELIKTYQPRYNQLLKDGRSLLYLTFSKEPYPRILFTRKKGDFGPFPSKTKLTAVLKLLRPIFPYCDQPGKGKPCFYYHLNLCPGACIQKISPTQYQHRLQPLKLMLKSKKNLLIRQLKLQLRQAITAKCFEQAIILRNQLQSLAALNRVQLLSDSILPRLTVDRASESLLQLRRLIKPYFNLPADYPLTRIEAYDISNLQGADPTGSMIVFIDGQPASDQYRYFHIRSLQTPNDLLMLKEVLKRRAKHLEWGIPQLILIDGGKNQVKIARQAIPWNLPIIGLAKHPDHLCLANHSSPLVANQLSTHLLQHLRNESHRFARRLHHSQQLKTLLF